MSNQAQQKSSWGVGIWSLYIGFVLFVLALVVFASVQSMDLVEEDYYQKELAYQDQIDRLERAQALPRRMSVAHDRSAKQLTLTYPIRQASGDLSGTVTLFRPSDADLDVELPVQTDATGRQFISTADLARGVWRLKILWQQHGSEYFHEEMLYLK